MSLYRILLAVQLVLSLLITGAILLQSQGSSGGVMWGGGSQSYHTRRGFEKVLHYFTYVAVALFVIVGILILKTA